MARPVSTPCASRFDNPNFRGAVDREKKWRLKFTERNQDIDETIDAALVEETARSVSIYNRPR